MADEAMGRWTAQAAVPGALLALCAGIAARLWHADRLPFWLDEAYSAFAADHGFGFLWHVVPRYETHPPFYYSLLRVWSLAIGDTVAARRALGILCGIAAVPVIGLAAAGLARIAGLARADRRWMICLALALAALHPLLVEMSRQVRPYPVMTLVYATATLALVRLLACTQAQARPAPGWIATFFVTQALMLWLHNLGALFACAMTLALAIAVLRRGLGARDWAWLIGGQLLAGLAYLPAFLIMLGQAATWKQSGWVRMDWAAMPASLGLIYATWNVAIRAVAAIAAAAGIALLVRRAAGGRAAAALLLMGLLPTLLSILLSVAVAPVFLDRTLSPAAIPVLLLVATGLAWPGWWRLLAAPAALAMLGSAASIDLGIARAAPMQDWYGTVAWLAPRVRPGDVIWAYPNEGALPLAYALRDERRRLPIRQIPAPVPAFDAGGYHSSGNGGTVSLYPAEIAALVARPSATVPPTIWLLRLNGTGYDPGDAMLHALERHRTVTDRWTAGRIDIAGLRRR